MQSKHNALLGESRPKQQGEAAASGERLRFWIWWSQTCEVSCLRE